MKLTQTEPQASGTYSLWLLTIAPAIWAAHFLLCYVSAAIWCAKFAPPGGSLGSIRAAIAWYTAVALVGITVIGWEGFRRHSYPSTGLGAGPSTGLGAGPSTGLGAGPSTGPWAGPSTGLGAGGTEATTHDLDSAEDRHRFLGFATLLLAGLSAVGVLYAAVAATFFESCR
jgi:hypothetical protein